MALSPSGRAGESPGRLFILDQGGSGERLRRGLLFALVFWGCLAFHSGGGWNQNARFAQVRAVVEQGRLAIDDYLIYRKPPGATRAPGAATVLRRVPIRAGTATVARPDGATVSLAWRGQAGALTPISESSQTAPAGGEPPPLVALEAVAASGDVSWAGGHFYPNKPPGASLLAVPAYAALFAGEKTIGLNPDAWGVLTLNAWLSTAFSIGLATAWGAVLLYGLARRFAGVGAALGVALAGTFGTMAFPNGTMLFDHNLTATLLLGAFALLRRSRESPARAGGNAFLAGLCLGGAVMANYLAAPVAVLLALYAGGGERRRVWFSAGAALPLAALAGVQALCFGSPLALPTAFQNPALLEPFSAGAKRFFGMFSLPNPGVGLILLFSPFRGLFFLSPVLLLAAWGLWRMAWGGAFQREARLCAAIVLLFFLLNAAYCGWHGGYGVSPRYLAPAVPFLALGLAGVWRARPRLCAAAACLSVAIGLVLTATDPLSPLGLGKIARLRDRPDWSYNPLAQYAVPLLVTGQPLPLLDALGDDWLDALRDTLPPAVRERPDVHEQARWLRGEIRRAARRGEAFPLPLAAFPGPVSANPMSVCEGDYFALFPPGSLPARWSAFNAGEFLFPESRWSLVAVGAVAAALGAALAGTLAKKHCAARERG